MKHLLNNLSEQEKNHIRNLHSGGMKVYNENFQKFINHKSGSVKPLLKESTLGVEPVIDKSLEGRATFLFNEGGTTPIAIEGFDGKKIDMSNWRNRFTTIMSSALESSGTLDTLKKFLNDKNAKIPKFISISVGTSSTPGDQIGVASGRADFLKKLLIDTFNKLGLLDERITQIITNATDYEYKPSELDLSFFDQRKVPARPEERFAQIKIFGLKSIGGTDAELDRKRDDLIFASGLLNVDEKGIVDTICSLGGYSDLKDIDRKLNSKGGLQNFINTFITDVSLGPFNFINKRISDVDERKQIVDCINQKSQQSGKGKIASIVGDKVSIIFQD